MGMNYSVAGGYGCRIADVDDVDDTDALYAPLAQRGYELIRLGSEPMGTVELFVAARVSAFDEDVREHAGGCLLSPARTLDITPGFDLAHLRALGLEPTSGVGWFVGIRIS